MVVQEEKEGGYQLNMDINFNFSKVLMKSNYPKSKVKFSKVCFNIKFKCPNTNQQIYIKKRHLKTPFL